MSFDSLRSLSIPVNFSLLTHRPEARRARLRAVVKITHSTVGTDVAPNLEAVAPFTHQGADGVYPVEAWAAPDAH